MFREIFQKESLLPEIHNQISRSSFASQYLATCSTLKMEITEQRAKTIEWSHLRRSGVSIANFEQVLHIALFPLLTLNKQMLTGNLKIFLKNYKWFFTKNCLRAFTKFLKNIQRHLNQFTFTCAKNFRKPFS